MKYLVLIACCLALLGCGDPGIATEKTNNERMDVTFLFENDGCKVYRFYDHHEYRYFATCSPGVFGGHNVHSGKTMRYVDDTVNTVIK